MQENEPQPGAPEIREVDNNLMTAQIHDHYFDLQRLSSAMPQYTCITEERQTRFQELMLNLTQLKLITHKTTRVRYTVHGRCECVPY